MFRTASSLPLFLALACMSLLVFSPHVASAACKEDVVWGSQRFNDLITARWGPNPGHPTSANGAVTISLWCDYYGTPQPTPPTSPSSAASQSSGATPKQTTPPSQTPPQAPPQTQPPQQAPQPSQSPQPLDANGCRTGERPLTAKDSFRKIYPEMPLGVCYDPSDVNIGERASDAREFLKNYATRGVNLSCLNAGFAEKLQTMIETINERGLPKPIINSAYRNSADQEKALASGASKVGTCGSYHQYGMAGDFNNSGAPTVAWIRANVPQFGLAVIGTWDPAHVQNGGRLPPRDQCMTECKDGKGTNGTLPDTEVSGPAYEGVKRDFENPPEEEPRLPVATWTPKPTPHPQLLASAEQKICIQQSYCMGNVLHSLTADCIPSDAECPSGCSSASGIAACVQKKEEFDSTPAITKGPQSPYEETLKTAAKSNDVTPYKNLKDNAVALQPVASTNAAPASVADYLPKINVPTFVRTANQVAPAPPKTLVASFVDSFSNARPFPMEFVPTENLY